MSTWAVKMPILDTALAWLRAGFSVIPIRADGSKSPAIPWQEFQTRRASEEEVQEWFTGHPEWGLGIVCGAISGGLLMVELEGVAAAEQMHRDLRVEFEAAGFPDLWEKLQTYVEMSPAGGLHWFVLSADGKVPGNLKLARRRNAEGKIQVLAETRGEGGQVVVAPSGGPVHPTGASWTAVVGTPGVVPVLDADELENLLRLFRTRDELVDETAAATMAPSIFAAPDRPAAADGQVSPGDDYAAKTDWSDILVPAGWRLVFARGTVRYWRRPGKNVGISATTGYGDHDLLYIFSSSTEFDPETSYSKLAAYAMLNGYGRDYAAAARELRGRGFGSRPAESPVKASAPPAPVSSPSASLFVAPGEPTGPAPATEDRPSWTTIDLTQFLDGTYVAEVPCLMRRADGQFLLYKGRVHSFHGESESGKSWCGIWAIAEALKAGKRAAMIDFESDPHTVVGRLLRMGVDHEAIRDRFDYRRPEANPELLAREHLAFDELLDQEYEVVILDGVTEALGVFGVPSKDNDEVSKWIRNVPRKIAQRTGAAVVLIDHVTKDSDSRGRFAIGGQAKMAALDGAAYVVEVLEPLGVGLVGKLSMRVAKDRPGGVRPHAGAWRKGDRTQEAAVVIVDSSQPGRTTVTVAEPRTGAEADDGKRKGKGADPTWRPTFLMQKASRILEGANAGLTHNGLAIQMGGTKSEAWNAIELLVTDGYAAKDGPPFKGYPTIRLINPYREDGR